MTVASLEACADTFYSLHYNYLLLYKEHKTTRNYAFSSHANNDLH